MCAAPRMAEQGVALTPTAQETKILFHARLGGGGPPEAFFSIATWRECNHLFKAPSALLHIGNATLGSGHWLLEVLCIYVAIWKVVAK